MSLTIGFEKMLREFITESFQFLAKVPDDWAFLESDMVAKS